ncbi:alcohol dehydrogenase IV [Exidia glandulosa HHB12029]|uniref:Alcohol dehydrogenase IV n=1 Tax=Exidia glandulosa HHB12029 TaxID=1314781 RepID=A0A165N723_EXIGL|nr:alcohol dehydrogenase IV [Exidia glandulosa HHB12029]
MTSSAIAGSYGWTDTLKTVYYGPGSMASALPKLIAALGAKRALVVTGKSLHQKTDVVRKVEQVLKEHDAYGATFWEIGEHSPIAGIRKGVDEFKNSNADIIVAVGGGSPVDASKAILYFIQEERGGDYLKQIAIPTTLSAAEYTIGAGYTDESGNKVAVSNAALAPSGVILDAELTLPTPERLWLSTGMRAMDHAVESLYRPMVPPPLKAMCYAAIEDLFTYLPQSKADPQNIIVRQKLQIASWMSLWPLKLEKYSPLGLSHSLGHKLGARYSIGHGFTSCLTLAPTVHLMATIADQEDKESLQKALRFINKPSTGSLDGDVHVLADAIAQLVEDLGLKTTLTQHKVPREDAATIAEKAVGGKDKPTAAIYQQVVKLVEDLY